MTNLNDLFQRDMAFRSIVIEAAARAIGSTSEDFAEEWLMHESCAQHADQRGQAKVDDGESYATNQPNGESDEHETPKTPENGAAKDGIRDFDADELREKADYAEALAIDCARLTAERDNLAADLADAMERIERYKSAMRDIGRAVDWCEDKGMA